MILQRTDSRVVLLGLGLLLLALLISCSSSANRGTAAGTAASTPVYIPPDPSILRVGVSTNAPPLIYKQGQDIVGLEAEFARGLAKYLGKSVHFVELDWQDQIPALLDGRTDIIMSGMSMTKMRRVRIAFSDPYFRTGQMALIHKRDENRFSQGYYSILVLGAQLKIGVVKATTGESYVKKNFGQARKISSFVTSREGVEALKERKVDLFVHDAPVIFILAAESESEGLMVLPSLLSEEYLAWGIRKNDMELKESANRFIQKLKDEGQLHTMVKRWVPYTR
jgi:polar amino acid transport system substrate-binding protein